MSKLINTEEVEIDGVVYIVEVYDSGTVVKYPKTLNDSVELEYTPTEQELITAEILLNQADIIAKQNEQDEVLAEILLNQMGV